MSGAEIAALYVLGLILALTWGACIASMVSELVRLIESGKIDEINYGFTDDEHGKSECYIYVGANNPNYRYNHPVFGPFKRLSQSEAMHMPKEVKQFFEHKRYFLILHVVWCASVYINNFAWKKCMIKRIFSNRYSAVWSVSHKRS